MAVKPFYRRDKEAFYLHYAPLHYAFVKAAVDLDSGADNLDIDLRSQKSSKPGQFLGFAEPFHRDA